MTKNQLPEDSQFSTEASEALLSNNNDDSRDSKKEELAISRDEAEPPKDNPKLAIFYFVMYTVFSTYNLIAGKFFRTWYPEMSTF